MNRWAIITVAGALIGIEFLSLRACYQTVWPQEDPSLARRFDDSAVALRDGSVMIAKEGTISRDVIDWFNNERAAPARFDIGHVPFEPNSATPSPETQVLLQRFAVELRANPLVLAKILACASSDTPDGGRLALARASRIKAELVRDQVDADHVSTRVCRPYSRGQVALRPAGLDAQFIGIELRRSN